MYRRGPKMRTLLNCNHTLWGLSGFTVLWGLELCPHNVVIEIRKKILPLPRLITDNAILFIRHRQAAYL